MGAWGFGPFDSDGALDYLGDLAGEHAKQDDEGEIDPATVDRPAVLAQLRAALAAVTVAPAENEYRTATCENAYAAAGLVAAVLAGHDAAEQSGTRLGAALAGEVDPDPLGLAAHCGFVAVLDPDTAGTLRPDAARAVTALRDERDYVQIWTDQQQFLTLLAALEVALADPSPVTG